MRSKLTFHNCQNILPIILYEVQPMFEAQIWSSNLGYKERPSRAKPCLSRSQSFTVFALWTEQVLGCTITSLRSLLRELDKECAHNLLTSLCQDTWSTFFWSSLGTNPQYNIDRLPSELHKADQISTHLLCHQKTPEASLHLWTRFVSKKNNFFRWLHHRIRLRAILDCMAKNQLICLWCGTCVEHDGRFSVWLL